ncbi:FERM domain containing protein [Oryctes borbonicus]|uniref:Sorting nexin-17 n=1 Tax=Oryctes borbonicus TaxID=1629725 RepID=A0A0T6B469_9SCAR|nr:FERM domain containing protein [Oryctes borbonicus]
MHFSIPDTQELTDSNGSTFMGYNIHINGVFHCTVRYRQLHNLHEQLKKEFGQDRLPHFPPKKLLPLTDGQLEERRSLLEKYIQIIGQDSKLVSSDLITGFLLSAQQETTNERKQELKLDIYTMNNYQISLRVLSTDRTEQVLAKACKHINLPEEYTSYFALFLIKKEETGDIVILRKLQDFESPYISYKSVRDSNRIVLRKSYWDNEYDFELMTDPIALNLLYTQTVSDIERGWILCTKEVKSQLAHFQARLSKREYIELARTLKYYGYIQFVPCYCDYPKAQTKVLVAIGEQELSLRLIGQVVKEGSFKVTRMRCWRITATHNKQSIAAHSTASITSNLELSFEYLMSKDNLQWITISSEQAILMSVCLQSMVDQLLVKRNGIKAKPTEPHKGQWSYMKRDGSSHLISLDDPDVYPSTTSSSTNGETSTKFQESFSIKKLQEKFSSVSFKSGKDFVENHAFEGIGDDDL